MTRFVSESITPLQGGFDASAMGRGEPGLPHGFTWRDQTLRIVRTLNRWKQSGPEVGRLRGESYLRRHYYALLMEDDAVWTVYFLRTHPRSGPAARRWFLYEIKPGPADGGADPDRCSGT